MSVVSNARVFRGYQIGEEKGNQETLEIDASAEDRIHPVHRLGSISFRAVDVTDEAVRLDISASYTDAVQELFAPIFG